MTNDNATYAVRAIITNDTYENLRPLADVAVRAPDVLMAVINNDPIPVKEVFLPNPSYDDLVRAIKMDIKTTGTDPERWMSLVRAGAKIEAIKEYRNQTGIGLKSSKDFIEFMWDFIRPPVAVAA
jgi:hypothetical protein